MIMHILSMSFLGVHHDNIAAIFGVEREVIDHIVKHGGKGGEFIVESEVADEVV